jgi:hypothetical protein
MALSRPPQKIRTSQQGLRNMTTPQRVARDQAGERTRYEDIEVGARLESMEWSFDQAEWIGKVTLAYRSPWRAEMLRAMATPGPAKKWPTGGRA